MLFATPVTDELPLVVPVSVNPAGGGVVTVELAVAIKPSLACAVIG